jgi:cell division protein FtsL
MNSKLAIPTDNIYKFLAIYGLVLIGITVVGFGTYSDAITEKLWEAGNKPTKDVELEAQYVEALVVKMTLAAVVTVLAFAAGVLSSMYGFFQWSKVIQKSDDKIRDHNEKKLSLEIDILQEELRIKKKKKKDDD